MKEFYLDRLRWIFTFSSRNFFYCVAKTLCILVGAPLYAVGFCVDMALTLVNAVFMWIPVFGAFFTVVCKLLTTIFDVGFYVAVLPDAKRYAEWKRVKSAEEGQAVTLSEEDYRVQDDQDEASDCE